MALTQRAPLGGGLAMATSAPLPQTQMRASMMGDLGRAEILPDLGHERQGGVQPARATPPL